MVTAIGAIVHATSQRADLVRFYRDGLGLGDPDHLQGEELFQVADLRLSVGSGEPKLRAPMPRIAITFIVDDLDEQAAHLKALGVPFDLEPTQEPSGTRRAVCRDPDGNFVTLVSGPRGSAPRRAKGSDDDGRAFKSKARGKSSKAKAPASKAKAAKPAKKAGGKKKR